MERLGWALALLLLPVSAVQANQSAEHQVLLHCAAVFDAREKWHAVMSESAPRASTLARHRDQLLAAAQDIAPPPGIHLRSGAARPSFETQSLRVLTRYAETGQVTPCSKDALCQACRDLLPSDTLSN